MVKQLKRCHATPSIKAKTSSKKSENLENFLWRMENYANEKHYSCKKPYKKAENALLFDLKS